MKKPPAWSYSSITLFDQCPKKYYHLRVVKDIVEPESEAMMYGKEAHTAAENFVRDGTPLPGQFSYMGGMLGKLRDIPGEKLVEHKMGLKFGDDGKFAPCGFFDPDVWFRGIADLLIINRDKKEARVVDYKTGKSSRYADPKQLALMAACVFIHFPEIEFVKAGLLFVVPKDFVRYEYARASCLDIFAKLDSTLVQRKTAYETGVFNPKQNFSCKQWCSVLDCPHNGRNV
jgi:hypothetical protein